MHLFKITERELEVLDLLAQEHTSQEIASRLFLSKHTIDSHKKNLKAKLKVKNSAGMVRRGFELGLLRGLSNQANLMLLILIMMMGSLSLSGQNEIELRTDGIVVPRTTTAAVSDPVEGQLIYDTSSDGFLYYDGSNWSIVGGGAFVRDNGGVVRQSSPSESTDDFLFGSIRVPVGGEFFSSDTLLFFDQSLGAFRGGHLIGQLETIGEFSFGFGNDVTASGRFSTAFGEETIASGDFSTAFGEETSASGFFSTAFGKETSASGFLSTAFGDRTSASGNLSTAFGEFSSASGERAAAFGGSTKATGNSSTALGYFTHANGFASAAMGQNTFANGLSSTAIGFGTIANAVNSLVVGRFNDSLVIASGGGFNPNSPLFIVGNGTNSEARNNALVVRYNGQVQFDNYIFPIDDGTTGQVLTTDGGGQLSWGEGSAFEKVGTLVRQKEDVDDDDFIFGRNSLPISGESITDRVFFFDQSKGAFRGGQAQGNTHWYPENIGDNSFAYGFNTAASGDRAVSFGTNNFAVGRNSASFGGITLAAGRNSASFGANTDAEGPFSMSIGRYNDPLLSGTSDDRDTLAIDGPLFIVGNGDDFSNRNNALVVRYNGQVEFDNYIFPIDDGITGQVMTTDGSGQLSWTTISNGDSDATNELQDLTLSGNTLSITDGNSVSLSSYLDNTDDWSNSGSDIHFSSGDVGLGTSTPEATLHIEAPSSRTDPLLTLHHEGSSFVRQAYANNLSDKEKWFILAQPRQANNTTNAFFRFFYTDTDGVANWTTDPGIDVFTLEAKGDATLAGTLMENSDVRLKEDITPLSNVLSTLSQISGYRYNWKNRVNTSNQIGLIAQEVQAVYPELVKENEEGMLSVSYTKMVPILLEAIKEQQNKISAQDEAIGLLLSRIEALEDKL